MSCYISIPRKKKASSLTVCEWRKIQFPFGCLHFCGFHYGIPSTEKRKTYQIQWKYSQYWFWIQSSVAIKAKWKHKVFQALDFWTKKSTHTHTHESKHSKGICAEVFTLWKVNECCAFGRRSCVHIWKRPMPSSKFKISHEHIHI